MIERMQIVYAAKSKSTYNIELNRVEVEGPFLLAKALMVSSLQPVSVLLMACISSPVCLQSESQLTNSSQTVAVKFRMFKTSRHKPKTCCQLGQNAALQILVMALTTQPGR